MCQDESKYFLFSVSLLWAISWADPVAEFKETTVNLRIEGMTFSVFEDTVSTYGHDVTTPSGGTHHCDGTNNNKNPCAGPTCTTALDDANKIAEFGFDGTFNKEYDDFLITSINDEVATDRYYWAILLNFKPLTVGGCQQKVKKDDDVLFAYTAVTTPGVTTHYMKLSGPDHAIINRPVVLKVTDGLTGAPIQNAFLDDVHKTDAQGQVSIAFSRPGTHIVKAEKGPEPRNTFVRSNQLFINVIVGP